MSGSSGRSTGLAKRILQGNVAPATTLFVGRLLVIATILIAWQLVSGPLIRPIWISSPSRIGVQLAEWVSDGTLWHHLGATIFTLVLGYSFGTIVGLLAGFVLGVMPRLEQVLAPFISAFWCLPKIALLPLFIMFLGIGIVSKVALVALVVVFLILYSTIDGVRDVDRDLVDLLRIMGAGPVEILVKVIIPSAVPWISTGLRLAVSYALITTVVCELLMSNVGLGFLIESSAASYNSAGVFAAVAVLVVLSVIATEALAHVEAHFMRWRT